MHYILVAITIKQMDHRWRLDLFHADNMQRLQRGVSFGTPGLIDLHYCK